MDRMLGMAWNGVERLVATKVYLDVIGGFDVR